MEPGAIERHFRMENQPIALVDSVGSETPPSAGWVREYPIGTQAKKTPTEKNYESHRKVRHTAGWVALIMSMRRGCSETMIDL